MLPMAYSCRLSNARRSRPAVGNYIRVEETADASAAKWVTLHPEVSKNLCNVYKGLRLEGKPIIQPLEDIKRRIHLLAGMKFRVSLSHRESNQDSGNGVILALGGRSSTWLSKARAFRLLRSLCPESRSSRYDFSLIFWIQ